MVKKEFTERHNKKERNEKHDRDDLAFWEQRKGKYLKENPTHRALIEELEEGTDASEGETDGDTAII